MKECFYQYATDTSVLYNYIDALNNQCIRCNIGPCIPVTHRGNLNSDIMLIGEALGATEEELRLPFVGKAGKALDKMFQYIELDTNKDMILSNIVMGRPKAPKDSSKQNLTPTDEQIDACFPYVRNLIRIIKPKVLIACGRIALRELVRDRNIKIKDYVGEWTEYKAEYEIWSLDRKQKIDVKFNIPMFVMHDPSYVLRQQSFMSELEYKEFKNEIKKYLIKFKEEYDKIKNTK